MRWIKLASDIFEDEKIRMVEAQQDGDRMVMVWIKLLCLAGKMERDGVFILENGYPIPPESLADLMRIPPKIVEKSLKIFQKFGMISMENGAVSITNWDKHQAVEQMAISREKARLRKEKSRARKAGMIDQCHAYVTLMSHVTERDGHAIDKTENRIDKNRIEKTTTPSPSDVVVVVGQWNEFFGDADEEWLKSMLFRFGNDVTDAIKVAGASRDKITYPKKYVEGMLINWSVEGKNIPAPKSTDYTQRPRNGEADRLERIKEAMNDAESEC